MGTQRVKKDKKVKKTGENSEGKNVYEVYELQDRIDDKGNTVQIQVPTAGEIPLSYALARQLEAQDTLDEWTEVVDAIQLLEPTE